ncbi:hypothetical protein IE53DRAFT_195797 [Violaceomyces palustris]|uniref:Uncharacterized protein n=2 Tax=Violaceomyces palustris TaxID=1673888 RepID=A0ACD0NRT2_9BASI|nr:hypothetical protein IE53DRAFT_226038 [Violaceomyces palustris]PWN48459.1 hypothetical protein IE53DRAFT_195797 [Violaceomyces palustris]
MMISITPALLIAAITFGYLAVEASPAPLLSLNIGGSLSAEINTKSLGKACKAPPSFTSAYFVRATPDTIVANDGSKPPGQTGAIGRYNLYLNSHEEKICWDIELEGVTGEYSSPAKTATHVHQANAGSAGPPRIAFPNPQTVGSRGGKEIRKSEGCMEGPFTTGVLSPPVTGTDTGSASGFKLRDIEANPSGFFGDTHTSAFTAGAVRGQLIPSELEVRKPKRFTSHLRTKATADQVVTATGPVAGEAGATGKYELSINSDENILCYKITLEGVTGDYLSPAKTATHIHQAPKGSAGPARFAFKNPEKVNRWWSWWSKKEVRVSESCVKGPFTTGLVGTDGKDTGSQSGFNLKSLEDNPSQFFADTHTAQFSAGAIRGQLERVY